MSKLSLTSVSNIDGPSHINFAPPITPFSVLPSFLSTFQCSLGFLTQACTLKKNVTYQLSYCSFLCQYTCISLSFRPLSFLFSFLPLSLGYIPGDEHILYKNVARFASKNWTRHTYWPNAALTSNHYFYSRSNHWGSLQVRLFFR